MLKSFSSRSNTCWRATAWRAEQSEFGSKKPIDWSFSCESLPQSLYYSFYDLYSIYNDSNIQNRAARWIRNIWIWLWPNREVHTSLFIIKFLPLLVGPLKFKLLPALYNLILSLYSSGSQPCFSCATRVWFIIEYIKVSLWTYTYILSNIYSIIICKGFFNSC